MTFYIQHGYGKGSKIADVADGGHLSGVILSPADEEQAALSATAEACRSAGVRVLLDPQAYVYATTPVGRGRCHADHGLDLGALHWSQSAAATSQAVQRVERANADLGIRGPFIAPTVPQSSFTDVWTPLAIQFARTAESEWGGDNTIASIVVDEGAFADWASVEDWLDVATTLDVAGFYILVDRHRTQYPSLPWEVARLTNLLRLIYRLSVLNDYFVVWGYSDFEGLLGLAAGADASSAGWSYSLRQFNVSKWQPRPPGGQAATARLTLARLWAPVRAEAEAEPLFESALKDELFSRRQISRFERSPFSAWGRSEAQVQHLRLLANLADRVVAEADVSVRVDSMVDRLGEAERRLQRASRLGIVLPPTYLSRVQGYSAALSAFASAEAL
ncbi:MAG: hypothetical protein IE926_08465 [Micrococcales bacterium]|nr:hypothetical protein [Micrococcales bacterium]